jgi:hypothetical protein
LWWKGVIVQLEAVGVRANVLELISSFFSEWRLKVASCGKFLKEHEYSRGSPQGSTWSPFFFGIYTRSFATKATKSKVLTFADDVPASIEVENNDKREGAAQVTSSDIQAISDNATNWNMKFSAGKSGVITISNKKDAAADENRSEVKLDGIKIEEASSLKILGVRIDSSLQFSDHIQQLSREANKGTFLLRRVRPFLNDRSLAILCKSHIRSRMEYACLSWQHGSYLANLDRVQERSHRFFRR